MANRVRWNSLQALAATTLIGCLLVIVLFVACRIFYDPEGSGIGIPEAVAAPLLVGGRPVVLSTLAGMLAFLVKTKVAVGKDQPPLAIMITSGAVFLYSLSLAGIVAALVILVLLSFHYVAGGSAATLAGTFTTLWGISTGFVFANFFAAYAKSPSDATSPSRGEQARPNDS